MVWTSGLSGPPSGHGEIDLVAWHGQTLVFVEVKTREGSEFGPPDRAVDDEKRENVERAAQDYARRAGIEFAKARFDIVSVTLTPKRQIEWIRDAWSPRADQ
jgi:putative endonuclease